VLARHGRKREDEDEALQLAQHAVEVVASADAPVALADTLVDQAMVLMQARQTTAGRQALRSARALYLLKGATLPLHRTEALLTGFEALLPDGEANLAAAPEPGLGSASSRAVAD
jgi:hypothetical protein